jgi:Zn-dependent protease
MTGIDDLNTIARLDLLCDDLGIDTMSTGVSVTVAGGSPSSRSARTILQAYLFQDSLIEVSFFGYDIWHDFQKHSSLVYGNFFQRTTNNDRLTIGESMVELFLIIAIPILFFSVMIHECAHGVVALFFGDDTAKREGRLSLNVIRHIDLVGTIILPLILLITRSGIIFGWAKPVPVRANNLRNPARDYTFVSLAGPISNILLAFFFAFILPFSIMIFGEHGIPISVAKFISFGVKINIILAMFNLLPIPPLDGSHVLAYLLPYPLSVRYQRFARYGFFIILLLILTDTLRYPFLFADYISRTILTWMYHVGCFFG